jgi:hypothetical protein
MELAACKTDMAYRMRFSSFIADSIYNSKSIPLLRGFASSCEVIYPKLQQKAETLNTGQRALAGRPAAGSPQGDMSGSEGGKPETEPRTKNKEQRTLNPLPALRALRGCPSS